MKSHWPIFNRELYSLELANFLGMVMKPARYAGFDTMSTPTDMVPVGSTGFKLSHNGSPIKVSDGTNTLGNKLGVIVSPHGFVLSTDEAVSLTVPNNGSSISKYYAVVCRFEWNNSDTPASEQTYHTILMDDADSFFNTYPGTDVKIGRIEIQANGNSYSSLVYTPDYVPQLAGSSILDNPSLYQEFARIGASGNEFNGKQKFNKGISFDMDNSTSFVDNHVRTDSSVIAIDFSDLTVTLEGFRKADGSPASHGDMCTIIVGNPGLSSKIISKSANSLNLRTFIQGDEYILQNGDVVTMMFLNWYTNTNGCYVVTGIQSDINRKFKDLTDNILTYFNTTNQDVQLTLGTSITIGSSGFRLQESNPNKVCILSGEVSFTSYGNANPTIATISSPAFRPSYDLRILMEVRDSNGVFIAYKPCKIQSSTGLIYFNSTECGIVITTGTTYKLYIAPVSYTV